MVYRSRTPELSESEAAAATAAEAAVTPPAEPASDCAGGHGHRALGDCDAGDGERAGGAGGGPGGDMVFVEGGPFLFGTDRPYIIPVRGVFCFFSPCRADSLEVEEGLLCTRGPGETLFFESAWVV